VCGLYKGKIERMEKKIARMERQIGSEKRDHRQTIAGLDSRVHEVEKAISNRGETISELKRDIENMQEEEKQTSILFSGALKVFFVFLRQTTISLYFFF